MFLVVLAKTVKLFGAATAKPPVEFIRAAVVAMRSLSFPFSLAMSVNITAGGFENSKLFALIFKFAA